MALKLRPTGLGSGIDKDRADYTVYCGGWDRMRIGGGDPRGRFYVGRRFVHGRETTTVRRTSSHPACTARRT
jgi:hypothetical protein